MEVALSSHQSVVITAQFYPSSEVSSSIKSEAHGPTELLFHKGHVFHGVTLFDAQHLLLAWKEVGEKFLSSLPILTP